MPRKETMKSIGISNILYIESESFLKLISQFPYDLVNIFNFILQTIQVNTNTSGLIIRF